MNSLLAPILKQDATVQSAALANGEITASELLTLTLTAIEAKAVLNCFIYIDSEQAREAAAQSDVRYATGKPLSDIDGLIVAVKDNIDVLGMPTTAATNTVLNLADTDAPVIAALRAAGAIILGKLNMDELALGTGHNYPHYGQCYNPNYPELVPGGSSGGSGAAVAAGLCSMALGTDTMGSVRIPAACNNIVGLKPTYLAISNHGSVPCSQALDHIGPLCRSLRDLDLWLPVLYSATNWQHRSESHPVPYQPQRAIPQPLSITVVSNLTQLVAVSNDVVRAYHHISGLLQHEGYQVISKGLNFNPGKLRRAGLITVEADITAALADYNVDPTTAVSKGIQSMLDWLAKQPPHIVSEAHNNLRSVGNALRAWLGECDVLLLPTIAESVPRIADTSPPGFADLTSLANAAGMPAISIPIGHDSQGSPMAMQLLAQPGRDASLIAAAKQLQPLLFVKK